MRTSSTLGAARSVALTALCLLGSATALFAQPGDVNGIDIRLQQVSATVLEVQLRPNATWETSDGVMNLTFAVKWETASCAA